MYQKLINHSNKFLNKHNMVKRDSKLFIYVKPFGFHRKPILVEIPENKEIILKEIYNNPETMKNGRDSFYNIVRQKYYISKSYCFDFLKKQENYQLHLKQPKEKILRPSNETQINSRWAMDFIDMQKYDCPRNRKKKWILTVIDIFSKKAFATALYAKTAILTAEALENIIQNNFNEIGSYPKIIQSDNGKEFKNNEVKELMKNINIKFINTPTYMPQANASIERFNRTLKNLIAQNFTKNNNILWVDDLPLLISNYNNSYHSTIKDIPNRIHDGNRDNMKQENIVKKHVQKWVKSGHNYPELKIGDKVRIHILTNAEERKNIFAKKYNEQWSREIYTISKIVNSNSKLLKKMYVISNSNKQFYRHDLQKISI